MLSYSLAPLTWSVETPSSEKCLLSAPNNQIEHIKPLRWRVVPPAVWGIDPSTGLDAIMSELKMGFRAIDVRFNTITASLEQMDERLDRQNTRIGEAERRISTLEDTSTIVKSLECLETRLKLGAIKNEELEARDRCKDRKNVA